MLEKATQQKMTVLINNQPNEMTESLLSNNQSAAQLMKRLLLFDSSSFQSQSTNQSSTKVEQY